MAPPRFAPPAVGVGVDPLGQLRVQMVLPVTTVPLRKKLASWKWNVPGWIASACFMA
jgi:hypothetical protein